MSPLAVSDDATSEVPDRPNILIVLLDDMGYSDLPSYGGDVDAPTFQRLANGGVSFRAFYQAARCCPTRAALLTGVYPHQAGVGLMAGIHHGRTPAYHGALRHDTPTIAEAIGPAGYATAHSGKWHVGGFRLDLWPISRGFDTTYGSPYGGLYYQARSPVYRDDEMLYERGAQVPEGWYAAEEWTNHAIAAIDKAHEEGRPFLVYLAYDNPHFPIQAPDRLVDKYRGRYRNGWHRLREQRLARQRELGIFDDDLDLPEWPHAVPRWESLSHEDRDRLDLFQAVYNASIESTDEELGRLIDRLEALGELDNTLIMVLSDNGGNAEGGWRGIVQHDRWNFGLNPERAGRPDGPGIWPGMGWATAQNTPFRNYKHDADEGGIRTPMIVHWPAGIPDDLKGEWIDEVGHVIDIMPTCLDLAGMPEEGWPAHEGVSLLPAILGGKLHRDRPLFWEHEGNAAIRDGDWKLVREEAQGWRLYNLANDPNELNNLTRSMSERRDELAQSWDAWADRVGVLPFAELQDH